MAVQLGVIRLSPSDLPVRVLLPLTIALTPVVLWPHRVRLGVWVIFVGLVANLSVVAANGGLMPIERRTVEQAVGPERAARYEPGEWIQGSKDVFVATGEGRAAWLGDSILIRVGDGGFAASPGDVVVWAGLIMLAAEASITWQRRARGQESHASAGATRRKAEGSATTLRWRATPPPGAQR